MIHTLELCYSPDSAEISIIKNKFIAKFEENEFKYYKYKELDNSITYKYYPSHNLLKFVVNLNKLLKKDVIIAEDYYLTDILINYNLKCLFESYSDAYDYEYKVSRVDYKIDIITKDKEEKELYLDLFKKTFKEYRALKQNNAYNTSIYFNSKSYNINIYDKEEESKAKHKAKDKNKDKEEEAEEIFNNYLDIYSLDNITDKNYFKETDEEKYKNLLRVEVQVKSYTINYMEKTYGLTKDLINYFNTDMYNYFIEKYLKQLNLFGGNFLSIEQSKKQLESSDYTPSMQKKLVQLQKDISMYGMSKAKEKYNSTTFNNYVKKLEEYDINVITIPRKYKKSVLENKIYLQAK